MAFRAPSGRFRDRIQTREAFGIGLVAEHLGFSLRELTDLWLNALKRRFGLPISKRYFKGPDNLAQKWHFVKARALTFPVFFGFMSLAKNGHFSIHNSVALIFLDKVFGFGYIARTLGKEQVAKRVSGLTKSCLSGLESRILNPEGAWTTEE